MRVFAGNTVETRCRSKAEAGMPEKTVRVTLAA